MLLVFHCCGYTLAIVRCYRTIGPTLVITSSQNIDGGYMLESEAVLTSTHDLRF